MTESQTVRRPETEPKFEFIDAARGFAIFLVVLCHTALPQEPWHIRRFTNLGWHGVQLFFIVSAMTLALSWRRRHDAETRPYLSFMIRRLFRIWPMYFVAFVGYLLVWPPGGHFTTAHMLTSLTFTHGWSPGLMPTDGSWDVVPGSWSVAAEFSFYLLFPLLIYIAATPGRALLLVLLALGVASICDAAGYSHYLAGYGPHATGQWVYYWFPNQLPIFVLGFVVFHCFVRLQPGRPWGALRNYLVPWCPVVTIASIAAFFALAFWVNPPATPSLWPLVLPIHFLASIAFSLALLTIGLSPSRLFVNRFTVWLGRVSFSAYLIHFAVMDAWLWAFPRLFDASSVGMVAYLGSLLMLVGTLSVTGVLASLAYRFVEQPMIGYGRLACAWLNRSAVVQGQALRPGTSLPTPPS